MKLVPLIIISALSLLSARGQVTFASNNWIRIVDGKAYDLSKGHELWHTNHIRIEQVLSNGIIVTMWLDAVGTNKPTLAFVPGPPSPPTAPGQTGKVVCMKTGTYKYGNQTLEAWDPGMRYAVNFGPPRTNAPATTNATSR